MTFGQRLRAAREERRLSVSQLAQAAKLSRTYIRDLESDQAAKRLTVDTVLGLARALDKPVAYLIGERNDEGLVIDEDDDLRDLSSMLLRIRELMPDSYGAVRTIIRDMKVHAETADQQTRRTRKSNVGSAAT